MPPKQAARSARSVNRKNVPVSPAKPAPVQFNDARRATRNAQQNHNNVTFAPNDVEEQGSPAGTSSAESDLQGELDAMDGELILDSLVNLHDDSVKILDFFKGQDADSLEILLQQLQDPRNVTTKRFDLMIKRFGVTRETFGGRILLRPAIFAEKLRDAPGPFNDADWRPDNVIYLANLALLAYITAAGNDEQSQELLGALSLEFPTPFTSSSDDTTMSMEIRTQHFINILQSDVPYDFENVVEEMFAEAFAQRGHEIQTMLDSDDPVGSLEETYPYRRYAIQMILWAMEKSLEVQEGLKSQGGAQHIVDLIQKGDFESKGKQGSRGSGKKQTRGPMKMDAAGIRSMNAVKRFADTARAAEQALRSSQEQQIVATEDEEIPINPELLDPNPTQLAPDPTQQTFVSTANTVAAMDIFTQQESRKENIDPVVRRSYLDRQPGATRVTFDDTQEQASPSKRRQSPDDDDDEFQNDSRPTPKRARVDKGKQRAPALTDAPDPFDMLQQPQHAQNFPFASQPVMRDPVRQSAAPSSSAPVYPAQIDYTQRPSTQHDHVRELAKQKVQQAKELSPRHVPQVRRKWEADELDRFLELMALNGPRYSKILKDDLDENLFPDGPKIQHRGQVALKDKARNIKFDYLKIGAELPEGFINVSISRPLVDKLRELGIDYVQGTARGHDIQLVEED